jgi:hypothetical protein
MVRLGVVLLLLSAMCWLLVPAVPFAGLGGAGSASAVAALLVVAEVMFWLGLVLAGRDTWKLARQHGWSGVPRALWRVLREGTSGTER